MNLLSVKALIEPVFFSCMCGAVVLTSETPDALPLLLHKHIWRGLVI